MEFEEFPKMARLTRECVISEKIDGTNAQIVITPAPEVSTAETRAYIDRVALAVRGDGMTMRAGSRTRYITPDDDNFGFAKWVKEHAEELWALGEGRHFGEWWGSGIQRGYGLTEKRFSLFNTIRWCAHDAEPQPIPSGDPRVEKMQERLPACVSLVPVLYRGLFGPKHDENFIAKLRAEGSMAAPGFMKPEGIVIFHVAANVGFKKTIEKDEQPKSKALATA